MTQDQELAGLIEEIRMRTCADLIAIFAALREITRTLEANEAVQMLMPELGRQNAFARYMKYAKSAIWRAMREVEGR